MLAINSIMYLLESVNAEYYTYAIARKNEGFKVEVMPWSNKTNVSYHCPFNKAILMKKTFAYKILNKNQQ